MLQTEPHPAADLEIWLQRREDGSYGAVITFRPPGRHVDEVLFPGEPPEIVLDAAQLFQHSLDQQAYGLALSAMFFASQHMREALIRARNRALGANVPLRLRLRLDVHDPFLHAIHWELLRDPTVPNDPFFCTDASVLFSRYLVSPDATPIHLGEQSAITALLAVAAPNNVQQYGLATIDRAREVALLQPALQRIKTTILERTTLTTLITALLTGPAILYLVCHGHMDDGQPYLWLENDHGAAERIAGHSFIERVRGLTQRPLLIVLASCESAGQSTPSSEALIALGPQLAQAGVGAVVAMHDNIAIATIQAGMPIFFTELGQHGQIDLAMTAMRNVLAARGDDWWQPVLFLRLADGALFKPHYVVPAQKVGLPARSSALPTITARAIERKQHVLNIVVEKIAFFEEQELLVTDPNAQFQVKKQLADLHARRAALEDEIARLRAGG